jgi:protocatechuate 3,4-dioxygenase beta subunit
MVFRPGPLRIGVSFDDNPSDTVPYNYTISGQTLDGSGNPLAGCAVHLFYTDITGHNSFASSGGKVPDVSETSDIEVAETVSDANGNYSFFVDAPSAAPSTYYIVAYLPGSPDVAGTTVNILTGG